MKRVLIIANFFSNPQSVATIRIKALADNLTAYGWQPTIICIDDPNNKEHNYSYKVYKGFFSNNILNFINKLNISSRTEIKDKLKIKDIKNEKTLFDKFWFFTKEWLFYPDEFWRWKKTALAHASDALEKNDYDAVISSFMPPVNHAIAFEIKKKYGIPWIADFRDLWTQNHYYEHSFLRKKIEKDFELKIVNEADILTTVSLPLAEELMLQYPNKYVMTITNGFTKRSDNNFNKIESEKLSIIHTGQLYRGKRDPEPLFKAVKKLINNQYINSDKISISFYGNRELWLDDLIKKYSLENCVVQKGPISRKESIKIQSISQILLLITWNDSRERGVYTSKVFEYLAAGRPILSIGNPDNVLADLILKTRSGEHLSKSEEIESYLMEKYDEFLEGGLVKYDGIDMEINKFSHMEMTKKFAEALDRTQSIPNAAEN